MAALGLPCWVDGAPPHRVCSPLPVPWCLQVSTSVFVGLVSLYIIFCLLLPFMVKTCNFFRWKINNIMASESSYIYSIPSNTRAFNKTSLTKSGSSSRGSSNILSKRVAESKAEVEETTGKWQT